MRATIPLLGAMLLLAGCSKAPTPGTPGSPSAPGTSSAPGMNGASSASADAASYRQFLPDPKLTPGATLNVTKEDICTPGYSSKVRNVPSSVKRKVYEQYGIMQHEPGEYEVDHLISLELGGSNSIRNLWPQSFRTQPWNAHVKDQLENKLHDMICDGEIDMKTAQQEIATDWIAAYKKYFKTDVPLSKARKSHRSRRHSRSGESRSSD